MRRGGTVPVQAKLETETETGTEQTAPNTIVRIAAMGSAYFLTGYAHVLAPAARWER